MNDATLSSKSTDLQELPNSSFRLSAAHNHAYSTRKSTVERLLGRPEAAFFDDEALEADIRGDLTPAQMVEGKLMRVLRGNPMPVRYLLNKARR
ncbi:MAG: hypothetical protein ACJ8FY_03625 [Gemmataceae bacterium]